MLTFYPHFVARRKTCRTTRCWARSSRRFAARHHDAAGHRLRPGAARETGLPDRRRPDRRRSSKDIEFGWRLAKEMGRLDVGQSVAVKDRAPLAVEAIEGTDECIRRAGTLCSAGGFTVVKVAKPQQDMRFDVPTIGLGTLETLVAAGGQVLAVEAGRTIIIDQPEVVEFANAQQDGGRGPRRTGPARCGIISSRPLSAMSNWQALAACPPPHGPMLCYD